MSNANLSPDWERIEADYRAGVLSLREIAGPNGVTEGAVRKRAKRDAWERDLAAKIQARAESLVRKAAVRSSVRNDRAASDREVVEANAERIAQVRGEHRSDIGRARALTVALLVELEGQTDNLPALGELGDLLRSPNASGTGKLNDLYQAVISLPERTKTVKALSEALKNIVGLEREAYNIGAVAAERKQVPAGLAHFYGDSEAE